MNWSRGAVSRWRGTGRLKQRREESDIKWLNQVMIGLPGPCWAACNKVVEGNRREEDSHKAGKLQEDSRRDDQLNDS